MLATSPVAWRRCAGARGENMRRLLAFAAVFALIAGLSACDHDPAPIAGQGWTEVWEDTFDYTSLDQMDDVWELSPPFSTYVPGEVQLMDNPSDTDPSDGIDRMVRLRTGAFQSWDWAKISTDGPRRANPEPNYPNARSFRGPLYVEAFVRYTENPHTWPAFWLFSARKHELWPNESCSSPPLASELTAEWDIMENGYNLGDSTSRFVTNVHRNTPDGSGTGWCNVVDSTRHYDQQVTGVTLGDWHLWAGYWRADGQLCTYLDDALLRCAPAYDSFDQPLVIQFDIARTDRCGCPLPSELTMDISNVRVLKPPA
jgi:hypothetical protein